MRVRCYQPGEEPQLWAWLQSLDVRPQAAAERHQHWLEGLRSTRPLVVEYAGQAIGYANLGADGEIEHFFVRQDWQGRGVGSWLMHRLHERAAASGCQRLAALVCRASRPFFLHWGFVPQAGSEQPDGSLRMFKALTA